MSNLAGRDGSPHYTLVTGDTGAARLQLLDDVYGRDTQALLAELGVGPGMRVADVGCGTGTMSCWLAQRVGPSGAVVGIDVSQAQLDVASRKAQGLGLTNLRLQQADAGDTGLPRASFDLAYCRFVLCHLARPERALREMHALLAPGGLIVCDDVDVGSMFADPPSPAVDRMRELMLAVGAARGVDYRLGLRLHRLLREVGFGAPQVRFAQPVHAAGEVKRFWEYTVLEAAPVMLEAGLTTHAEVERLSHELATVAADPTTLFAQARMVQVWARK